MEQELEPENQYEITDNKNALLNGNDVDVDILPKVGGNSIVINICSCFNWSYSDSDKRR